MREQQKVVFDAALVRIVLGLFATLALPNLYPKLAAQRPILGAYVACTLVMQVLIWKDIGGATRSFVSGLVDVAVMTFLVHRVGSVGSMIVSLYVFSAMMNSLVVKFRVGVALAVIGALAYAGILAAEQRGWVPYGPDAPAWASGSPGGWESVTAACLVGGLMVLASTVTGLLVQAVRRHEAALTTANAQLEELSQRDPLTQLYNRRHLMARIEAELQRVRRGHPLALVMIDLDGFKRVNDRQGHLRGDLLLQELAAALLHTVRATDVAGRYGGDEFVILLPDTDAEHAWAVAGRLAASIAAVGLKFDDQAPVTGSVGVAIAGADDGVAALIRRADENAYRAKSAGGNRVISA